MNVLSKESVGGHTNNNLFISVLEFLPVKDSGDI